MLELKIKNNNTWFWKCDFKFQTSNLIISNEQMNDIMKIIQALEDSNILLKGVTKTIKNETKEQKGGFLSMLLGTLGASLLGNLLAGKGIVKAGSGNKKGSWYWSYFILCFVKRMGFLMLPHPLTNFEIQRYYQNEPRFNSAFSRNNLPKKIKHGAYVINLANMQM